MIAAPSSVISKIRSVWKRLSDKEYRDHFVSLKIDSDLSAQIYALRMQRDLTQLELGNKAQMAQSRIAKLEGSCDGVSIATLKRLASACDVALSVRFVSFNELLGQSLKENLDRWVPDFVDDHPPVGEFTLTVSGAARKRVFPPANIRSSRSRWNYASSSSESIFKENVGGNQSARL